MTEDAPQREYPLRQLFINSFFNGLRWMARAGAPWRLIPNDLPPWHTVYEQTQRWIKAGCFAAIVHDLREILHDLRELLRVTGGRNPKPTAAVLAHCRRSRWMHSALDPGKRRQSRLRRLQEDKVHVAVDTLGHLLAVHVTPANEQERAQVAELAAQVQKVTEQSVTLAYVDQGYTGEAPAEDAKKQGIALEVVKLPEARKGFVLLPRRWVVERSFAWAARFRRLAKDYERLPETLAGLHFRRWRVCCLPS